MYYLEGYLLRGHLLLGGSFICSGMSMEVLFNLSCSATKDKITGFPTTNPTDNDLLFYECGGGAGPE